MDKDVVSRLLSKALEVGFEAVVDQIEKHHDARLSDLTDDQVLAGLEISTPRSLIDKGERRAAKEKAVSNASNTSNVSSASSGSNDSGNDSDTEDNNA